MNRAGIATALSLLIIVSPPGGRPSARAASSAEAFGSVFWDHWGDGQAELAGYDLQIKRYGESRSGTAVTIFVTETFSNSLRVKADPGQHPKEDELPAFKLNLVQDFSTGVYDYNMMTSTFVAIQAVNGREAGQATKVSFSSQEWCGHVWWQALFDQDRVRLVSHSYFDGEADQDQDLESPENGISEDALFFWARGLGAPFMNDGERQQRPVLSSAQSVRLGHHDAIWAAATFARGVRRETIEVPAGRFDVNVNTVDVEAGDSWTFWVEAAHPYRIIRWATKSQSAELIGSKRLKYWEMNGLGRESAVEMLGLTPRPPRTP